MKPDAFFLDARSGRRFCLATRPSVAPVGGLLYLHPFAEELNKTRRMAALAARAFAAQGWLVLQIDHLGCGDSAGDFGDAAWHDWIDDAALAWRWLRGQCEGPLALWTLRAGSLVAADWLAASGERPPWLMWQPVFDGDRHLAAFLRLKAAGEMLEGGEAKATVAGLRARLAAGEAVEVAGYRISSPLAAGMAAARLESSFAVEEAPQAAPAAATRLHAAGECRIGPAALFEIASAQRASVSPAVEALVRRAYEAGVEIAAEAVVGPAFWQSVEIEAAPGLIERSCAALARFLA